VKEAQGRTGWVSRKGYKRTLLSNGRGKLILKTGWHRLAVLDHIDGVSGQIEEKVTGQDWRAVAMGS